MNLSKLAVGFWLQAKFREIGLSGTIKSADSAEEDTCLGLGGPVHPLQ